MHPSPPETRASLILQLRDPSNAAAWDEFTRVYGPVVFRLAISQGLQSADADDLVQEVFSAVARSVTAWVKRDDRGGFRAWLFRIARNTAIDFLTRRKHQPWAAGGANEAWGLEQIPDADVSSDFDIEYRREIFHSASRQVREAVTEKTWQAFWLTSVEDRPISEVAQSLGMTVGGVYIARSRVLKRLRALVKRHGELDADDKL